MVNRRKAFNDMFEIFLKEGRVLDMGECRQRYPVETKALRSCASNTGAAFRRMRVVFKRRWHEIGANKPVQVVEPKPVEPKPVEPIEKEPQEGELSPLDKLRLKNE